LDDIISRGFSRWVGFWRRVKLTTSILHINIDTNREGVGASGVSGIAAGEGLARLDDGSLIVGFFLLRKKVIRDGKQQ
jgi:hypothetical protein